MKAVGYRKSLPIEHEHALIDLDIPAPEPQGRDLLVEVEAVSVNPVDTKVRKRSEPSEGAYKILGWDAAGIVREVGKEASLFRPGDRVWYAGSIDRPGSNAELQLVDERIVGRMPKTLDFAQAAALPLTSMTAWELLFDRLQIARGNAPTSEHLLIIGAAGGVGSIMVQLAKRLTGLAVIGTASRPQTQDWLRKLGVDHVVDHGKPLTEELHRIGVPNIEYIASLTHTDTHFEQAVEALAPQGRFGLIDDPEPIDVRLLKRKSASLHWELMFTRAVFQTADMIEQHRILTEVARMVDEGLIRTTVAEHYGRIDAVNLKRAHALIESGRSIGKIVLEGF